MKNTLLLVLIIFSIVEAQASSVLASDFGYSPIDATLAFQNAINSDADTVVIDAQSSNWIVQPSNFFDLENKVIIFETGVVLEAKSNSFPELSDCLMRLIRCNNISILGYGATFKMQKTEYTNGEWRHALSIMNSNDITVEGLILRDSGGDGIYISGDTWFGTQLYSENIIVRDCIADNNRRQGMSVCSVQNLLVENCTFQNTVGALPEAGLDIEPFETHHRLVNLVFRECRFVDNFGYGIQVSLQDMDDSSMDLSITFEDCFVSGNHDPSNPYAYAEISCIDNGGNGIDGQVTFNRCVVADSEWTALFIRKSVESYAITLNNCVFKNISQDPIAFNNPIFFEVTDYDNPTLRFGGANFNDCLIDYDADIPFFAIYENLPTSDGLGDIQGNFTVRSPNTQNLDLGANPENVEINYTPLTDLPATTIEAELVLSQQEEGTTEEVVHMERSGSDFSYPLPYFFELSGVAENRLDYGASALFGIIEAGQTQGRQSFRARQDAITEGAELVEFTLRDDDCYELGTTSNVTFEILDEIGVLAVDWLDFYALQQIDFVSLHWSTAATSQLREFIIERATDGYSFQEIGSLSVEDGEATYTQNWTFLDKSPLPGSNYYRIKELEWGGQFTYSRIIHFNYNSPVNIFPNPVIDVLITQHQDELQLNKLSILDARGREWKSWTNWPAQNQISVEELPSGYYQLQVLSKQGVYALPFVKL